MNRVQVYAGQIPLETHVLLTNQFAMLGIAKLAEAMLGRDNVWVTGLNCIADPITAFTVDLAAGQIYQLAPTEPTVYGGSLAADSNLVLKQGTLDSPLTFATPKPSSGNSVFYLISAAFVESDDDPEVLLYYNAANPSQAFSGPNGNGAPQATTRRGHLSVQMTTGIAATTGSETVPATPPGYTALWTVRVSSGTVSITNASSASTDGIWKVGANHFIVFGGTGDLTQSTADLRYGRLAFDNAWTARQTINFNDPQAIRITGSSSSAGAGIKITGDGGSTPSKVIRVRSGAFGIQNDAGSPTDILLLSDAGNLSVTGTITAVGKMTAGADPTNALDLVTKQYGDAHYATASDISRSYADAHYAAFAQTSVQTFSGQLIVPAQPTSGTVPANQLVTQQYVDTHYASLATSGITQPQADVRYLQLAASGPQTVTTNTTFSNAVILSTAPSADSHAVNRGYANTTYAQLAVAATFASTVGGAAPTASGHFTTRAYTDATYLALGGSGQSVTKTVTFTVSPVVPTGATGNMAVGFAQVQGMITAGQGISQHDADLRYGQLNAANSWSANNSFANVVTCLTDATQSTHLITKGRADQLYATLAGPTFTDIPKGPGGNSGVTNGYVTWQQVFGGGGGGFATLNANTFVGTQTINPASGDNLVLGTNPGGFTGITFPGNKKFGILNSSGNYNFTTGSGTPAFVINATTGDLSNLPGGSLAISLNISAGGSGTFGGPVAVGQPTSGGHAVRRDNFSHGGNINLGSLVLPNGYIINWGTIGGLSLTGTPVSFHRSYSSQCLALVTSLVSSSSAASVVSNFGQSTSGFTMAASASGTTGRFISIGI